jgi:hypothetical protein
MVSANSLNNANRGGEEERDGGDYRILLLDLPELPCVDASCILAKSSLTEAPGLRMIRIVF